MAKKALAPKLQENIQTDEELYTFLDKPGLWVLDIYSEWCGPCLGMVGSLRKLKLDLGDDNLNYAICKADTIEVFKRFRRKSEPTWLFVVNHKAVNIMFGSNVPQLLALITYELRLVPLLKRNFYTLSELLPEELKRHKIKEDALKKALALEFELKERKRLNYLYEVTDIIMENLNDMGVTIFGPQVTRDYIKAILQKAEQLKIQCKERKTVEISKEHFRNIHFDCPNPIAEELLEQLEGKELLICYWKVVGEGEEVPQILQQFSKELQVTYTQSRQEEGGGDFIMPGILEPLEVEIEVEIEDFDITYKQSNEKLLTPLRSIKSQDLDLPLREDEYHTEESSGEEEEAAEVLLPVIDFDFILDIEDPQEQRLSLEIPQKKTRSRKLTIPPIWVPNNQRTHAALIYTYFRNQTRSFLPPDPQPEPPYVIMAFDVYKRRDLILHVERLKEDVPMYGFFTSDDADEAKYIANSLDKYRAKTSNDKLVLKVKKATSHTMLQLVTYGPSYVSPNPLIGQEEALKFFPSTFKTSEQEAQEKAEELMKKKLTERNKVVKKMPKTQRTPEIRGRVETPDTLLDKEEESHELLLNQEAFNEDNTAHTSILSVIQQSPAEAA